MKASTLRVLVEQAKNLVAKDRNGKSDPYVTLKLGQSSSQQHKTVVIPKTLNPVWLTEFDFTITPVMPEGSLVLDISVWDKDLIGKDFMGLVQIPISDVLSSGNGSHVLFDNPENTPHWYPLVPRNPKEKVSGEIRIKMGFVTELDPEMRGILESFAEKMTIKAQVVSTDDLADEAFFNHFVKNEIASSSTSSDPTLNNANAMSGGGKQVGIDSTNNSAATATVNSSSSSSGGVNAANANNNGGGSGGQDPKSLSHPPGQESTDDLLNGNTEETSLNHSELYGMLAIDIVSAANLPYEKNMIKTTFDCDPFVVMSYGKRTFRTRVVRHTLNPVWNERSFLHIKSSEFEKDFIVKFSIYDYDTVTSNDHIGTIELRIQELVNTCAPLNRVVNEPTEVENKPIQIKFKASRGKNNQAESTFVLSLAFVPYADIRRNFWLTLARTYDADNDKKMNQVELITLLDSIGSTFSDEQISLIMQQGEKDPETDNYVLTYEKMFEVLEAKLFEKVEAEIESPIRLEDGSGTTAANNTNTTTNNNNNNNNIASSPHSNTHGSDANLPGRKSLTSSITNIASVVTGRNKHQHHHHNRKESHIAEHVIQLSQCPICQKHLGRRNDLDVVSHVALCAYSDLTKLDRFVTGGLLTEQYASRKWYTKILAYVTYGGYGIGKNNANILVQNRSTGQLVEEKMPSYIRLGIRLLYQMKASRNAVESKTILNVFKSMSTKQGKKFDDPSSVKEIPHFIQFHQLPLDEILEPIENFKNFNEFFYRKLKPGCRQVDSPDDPTVAVSPADCRLNVFPTIHSATNLWIKGSNFTLTSLLGGDAEKARLFENGSIAICRLAPQDYHRFHIPVDGVIGPTTAIDGNYYTVNPMAIRTAVDVYTENIRNVTYIESEQFGTVAYVAVGAMMVGTIRLTTAEGQHVKRMDEHGYFAFGGSTCLIIFQKNKIAFDRDLVENSSQCIETLVKVGNSIGRAFTIDTLSKSQEQLIIQQAASTENLVFH